MAKTVGDMTPQELIKFLIPAIGKLIKAETRTVQVLNEANIKASEERMTKKIDNSIKMSEERLGEKIDKVSERIDDNQERLSALEESTGLTKRN